MKEQKRSYVQILPPFALNIVMGFMFGGVAAIMPLIRDEFSLTHTQVGFYTTAVFFASFASALLSGYLIDQLGIRKGLALGGMAMALFVGAYALSPTYNILLLLACGAGLGQSLITPAGNKAIIAFTAGAGNNTLMGFFRSGTGIGSLMGASIIPFLALQFNWRLAVLMGASLGFLTTLSTLKTKEINGGETQNLPQAPLFQEVKSLMTIPRFRFLLFSGFAFASVFSVIMGYIPLWLRDVGNLSPYYAGLSLGLAQFGSVLGRPAWGYLVDRFSGLEADRALILQSAIAIVMVLSFAFLGDLLPGFYFIPMVFVLGCSVMAFDGIFFGFVGSLAGSQKTGVATGMALTFIRLGVVIIPPVFGFVADSSSSYMYSWLMVSIFPCLSILYYFKIHGVLGKERAQGIAK